MYIYATYVTSMYDAWNTIGCDETCLLQELGFRVYDTIDQKYIDIADNAIVQCVWIAKWQDANTNNAIDCLMLLNECNYHCIVLHKRQ